jgi:hypothetical protein
MYNCNYVLDDKKVYTILEIISFVGQVCLQGSEMKKIIYLGFVPFGGH